MSIPGDIAGGIVGLGLIAIYVLLVVLTVSVLVRLVILLPVLTRLGRLACAHLEARPRQEDKGRRLLEVEKMLRRQQITPEEYDAKRRDILNDL